MRDIDGDVLRGTLLIDIKGSSHLFVLVSNVTIWAVRDGFVLEAVKQSPVSNTVGATPNTEATLNTEEENLGEYNPEPDPRDEVHGVDGYKG